MKVDDYVLHDKCESDKWANVKNLSRLKISVPSRTMGGKKTHRRARRNVLSEKKKKKKNTIMTGKKDINKNVI